jgi:hypothetical protein
MLFRETVAVYCENHTELTDTVRTSQETHYVSATKSNRLMLFRETVAVHCENRTEHTNPVRTLQETHYVSATTPNRLMLFRETVAVYCEGHTVLCGQNAEFRNVKSGATCSDRWEFHCSLSLYCNSPPPPRASIVRSCHASTRAWIS